MFPQVVRHELRSQELRHSEKLQLSTAGHAASEVRFRKKPRDNIKARLGVQDKVIARFFNTKYICERAPVDAR